MKLKTNFLYFILFIFSMSVYGQMNQYNYKRELKGIKNEWHKIELPTAVLGKLNPQFSDIKIYGITSKKDTLEVPYLLSSSQGKLSQKEVAFDLLNISSKENAHYFTLEVPNENAINQLKLSFENKNFDWKVTLEGSQDQQNWYTIVKDYRIVSVRNELTDYQFTVLNFPSAKYNFFRIKILSNEKPQLLKASLTNTFKEKSTFKAYPITIIKDTLVAKRKESILEFTLKNKVPISHLQFKVADRFDYYRPIKIEYLKDSTKIEKGWHKNYHFLTQATLSSLEENSFLFEPCVTNKVRITITNENNPPLKVDTILVKGYHYYLTARFTTPANYYLTYGNEKIRQAPHYDIEKFEEKIPKELAPIHLQKEEVILKNQKPQAVALFNNPIWLWILLIAIILILGFFTLKMLQKK